MTKGRGAKSQAGRNGSTARSSARATANVEVQNNESFIADESPPNWAEEQLSVELGAIKNTVHDDANVLNSLNMVTDLLEKLLADNTEKAKTIQVLEKRIEKLENCSLEAERKWKREKCIEKRNDFIIRGVDLHRRATDGSETMQQTEEVCNNILTDMGAAGKVRITKERIRKINATTSEESKQQKKQAIKISLADSESKSNLFKCLGTWKRTAKNKPIRFLQDFPEFLKKKNDELEEISYNIRSSSNGKIKTRIFLENEDLTLKTKSGKEKWVIYDTKQKTQ